MIIDTYLWLNKVGDKKFVSEYIKVGLGQGTSQRGEITLAKDDQRPLRPQEDSILAVTTHNPGVKIRVNTGLGRV